MSEWNTAAVALSDFWEMDGAQGRIAYFKERGIPMGNPDYLVEMEWEESEKRYVYRWRLKDA